MRRWRAARGFTLVELMVGLAVGLFVSVIAVSLFVSTRKLQSVNSASNRMAENARLAFDLLHKDLRLAGFRGCSDQYTRAPDVVLNAGNGGFLVDASGMLGFHGTGSGFNPALSPVFNGVNPAPLNNSDIVAVRVPVDPVALALVASMSSNSDTPNIGTATAGNNLIGSGDVVMMGNCKSAVLFQVTAATTNGLLAHAVGGAVSPGNASTDLRAAYNRSDTAIYRMQTRYYYVAPSVNRPGTNSLWQLTLPSPGGALQNWVEIVPGIDALAVSYGVETDAVSDRSANRYITADGVTDWSNVLSARIQMLTTTVADGTARAASSVQFAGSAVNPGDRRLREVFTEVVSFRNQTP